MTEAPKLVPAEPVKDASASSPPKNAPKATPQNPVFRMMGLPNFRLKLPSRNWLIFLSITGSFTTALLYDRHHKKRAQARWSNIVSHLAHEALPMNTMPRRITIFLSAPPGDGLRVAREHFHEYVKPILVAGALDWDVIEGRREGDVRASLAEKIRRLRRRKGEKGEAEGPPDEDLVEQLRQHTGMRDWDGVQGDLVMGRNTWKEYIRGLHEGWLGSLDSPPPPEEPPSDSLSAPDTAPLALSQETQSSDTTSTLIPESSPARADNSVPASDPPPEKKKPSGPTPPYISPSHYATSPASPFIPDQLPPTMPLPFPHVLGFRNTPTRFYRFLTRRYLADETGRQVAALVLASSSRPYTCETDFSNARDPDSPASLDFQGSEVEGRKKWEQEGVLKEEEGEWHKSARAENKEGEERERPWKEDMVVDSRIGERMQRFELPAGEDERAAREERPERKIIDGAPANQEVGKSWAEEIRSWFGMEDKEMKGWEMGLVGHEDE